ncbi:MAG: hypothetical protein LBU05_06435 [Bifidobacteriaceae bacterium]|jgi:hypothetical protein|nr:hypothetical protein [Bifidobacteriaceae bacterium]
MPAPPFRTLITPEFGRVLAAIKRTDLAKHKKVLKAVRLLREHGPAHLGSQTHQYESLHGPDGQTVWESYVENKTPGAWRLWWWHGPDTEAITLLTVGPHP